MFGKENDLYDIDAMARKLVSLEKEWDFNYYDYYLAKDFDNNEVSMIEYVKTQIQNNPIIVINQLLVSMDCMLDALLG